MTITTSPRTASGRIAMDFREPGTPRQGEQKRVGLWIRVSTEDQARGESPEHHEARGRMYAEVKGWEVVRVYHLEAVSGKSVMGHPETAAMLEDIRAGRISGLIFSKLARFARNTKELLEFAEIFREEGADLISLQESIDTSTPAGRFFYTLIAALAQWEREEISERIAASVPIRAKLGKPIAGRAPFGYRWEDKARLVPDPAEAPVLKLAFELFQTHRSLGRVARLLNDAGHRSRAGRLFKDSSVHKLITNPVAKGLRRANYSRSDGKRRLLKPEHEWVWVEVPPVVSEALFDACNAVLRARAEALKDRPGRPAVHLFSGLVVCACGPKMYVPSNTPKYVCKACRNKIPIVDLEQVFREKLRDFFREPEDVSRYLAQGDTVLGEKEALRENLVRDRERLAHEMEKLYRLYVEDGLSSQTFAERHRPLEERVRQLDEEIPRLQGEIDFLKIQKLSSGELVSEAQFLYARWPEMPFEDRRILVEHLVERIVVGEGEITIDLGYRPPSHKSLAKTHPTRTTVPVWSTLRLIFRCARSGCPRAGTPRGAPAGSSPCPASVRVISGRGSRPPSAGGG